MKQLNVRCGRSVGEETLRLVVGHAAAGLRVADIHFRYDRDELVALLNDDPDSDAAKLTGERIREHIGANPLAFAVNGSLTVDVEMIADSSPTDGDSLPALIETARSRTPSHPR